MKILLLCEGDAETYDSWSGISRNVVEQLRDAGHTVVPGDVDLAGPARWIAGATTWHPDRTRWWVRYHLGAIPFRLRSRNAAALIRRHQDVDLILQIGATFRIPDDVSVPVVFYGDSNILLAEHGRRTGYGEASSLTPAEIRSVEAREARVYARLDHLFTLSERLRRSFIEDFGLAPDQVTTIHGGANFDVDRIPWPRPAAEDAPPTVLFVGRQFHRKGGDLLLEAFRTVRSQIPDARLKIVGPPDLSVDEPGVDVLGFLRKDTPDGWQRLVDAYAQSHVFALPTRFEPFGIAFLEAMCFGLPCVGPDVWAVPEMVVHGETGFITPPEDPAALAERIVQLLQDRDLADRMGRKGRARVLDYFTWSAAIGRMLNALDDSALGAPAAR